MGRILVTKAALDGERIKALEVRLLGIGARTITREQAISWMRDGHSFLPSPGTLPGRALQLVEVGDAYFIRDDHKAEAADLLPALPAL